MIDSYIPIGASVTIKDFKKYGVCTVVGVKITRPNGNLSFPLASFVCETSSGEQIHPHPGRLKVVDKF